ncbi:MAG: EF2563 family selenium-dependent molybdenum hydroxylase system protein [Candidatus Zixiibacteriota bacterium]|nr:MAG: EF2563 family selenium-dependent molybdenum hydroxylase system protein [candidate division Zixibacteria bacterium]
MNGNLIQNHVVVRGAGEMASGVIRRLSVAGFKVIALEQAVPTCIRRTVCYAEAFFEKAVAIEGVTAILVNSATEAAETVSYRLVPLLIDPNAEQIACLKPMAVIDARMLKQKNNRSCDSTPINIGLGPGFIAGEDCQAVVETNRGFDLGRVIYHGSAKAYTGTPAAVGGISHDRVLKSPAGGEFKAFFNIANSVIAGQFVGEVGGTPVVSRISGVIRGLIRNGQNVSHGQKIGDVDPRGIKDYCFRISDKANAVGGGVLEAVMTLQAKLAHN